MELTFFPLRRKGEAEKFIVLKNTSGARGVADIEKQGRERNSVLISWTEVPLPRGLINPRTPGLKAGCKVGRMWPRASPAHCLSRPRGQHVHAGSKRLLLAPASGNAATAVMKPLSRATQLKRKQKIEPNFIFIIIKLLFFPQVFYKEPVISYLNCKKTPRIVR